jgi:hypothetical protein
MTEFFIGDAAEWPAQAEVRPNYGTFDFTVTTLSRSGEY